MREPIQRAIDAAGGVSALARRIGVSPQVVANWRARGVPPGRVLAIEEASNGVVTRHELRPDVFGNPPDFDQTANQTSTHTPAETAAGTTTA